VNGLGGETCLPGFHVSSLLSVVSAQLSVLSSRSELLLLRADS
jgi:hypothetical protein